MERIEEEDSISEAGYTEFKVEAGRNLAEWTQERGIFMEFPCGGRGKCGNCLVQVIEGVPEPTAEDRRHLTRHQLEAGYRLACRLRSEREMVLRIPDRILNRSLSILEAADGRDVVLEPNVMKVSVEMDPPSPDAPRSHWERVKDQLPLKYSHLSATHQIARLLPAVLEGDNRTLTITLAGGEAIALERGNTTADKYGLAVDLGTTTVVAYLLDLNSGKELAVASGPNLQEIYGADVMSRISLVISEGEDGAKKLQQKAVESVNSLLNQLVNRTGVERRHIYEVVMVGNTTMNHLFIGIDPTSLGMAPYVPVVKEGISLKAGDLGIGINPDGVVFCLPNVAGFVGADTVGVLLTTLTHEGEDTTLAIDVGTNGEIVLGSKERILVCSAAAGPAFEGAQIRCGMRALSGAINRIWFDEDVHWSTIDDVSPGGICGSGLIDAAACLLDAGIVLPDGRFSPPESLSGRLPAAMVDRVRYDDSRSYFILVEGKDSATGRDIVIDQRDIRQLQLAKGAILAGIMILVQDLGIQDADIRQVLLAGGFGNFLNTRNARRIGLIPHLPPERVRYVGNAAGFGAKIALLSVKERESAKRIASSVEYIELTTRKEFQDIFMNTLEFPADEGR